MARAHSPALFAVTLLLVSSGVGAQPRRTRPSSATRPSTTPPTEAVVPPTAPAQPPPETSPPPQEVPPPAPEPQPPRAPPFPPPDHEPPRAEAFPVPRGPFVPLGFDARNWRPAPPTPPPPIHWDRTTAIGVALGLGAPYGYAGGFLAYNHNRWFQLEIGGGYSAPFGPAVGFMARGGLPLTREDVLSLGVGLSTNFTNANYVVNCTYSGSTGSRSSCLPSGAPTNARESVNPLWLNFEVSNDLRLPSDFGLRFGAGLSVLANTEDFPAARGCQSSLARVPCSVGLAHEEDRIFWEVYVHAGVYFLIANGAPREPTTRTPPRRQPATSANPPREDPDEG